MINTERIFAYLESLFPNAHCELEYTKDYELLIAIILSAQCTDKRVNMVTREMFKKYPTLESLNKASLKDIENEIKSLGLFKNKAKSIKETVRILLEEYDGVIPKEKAILTKLPGVGNKTANVFRAEWYKEPEIAVDTHVARVSKRLGFANEKDDVSAVERKLRKQLKKEQYIKAHHLLIHFGRYFCKAINPNCEECQLKDICRLYNSKLTSKR
ncbi:MAG: endonuclease III [Erysipelotrichales bacterium]|nr:endonuclease III [Erysipelotrichales bacterium]